jgi:hypothetical protein
MPASDEGQALQEACLGLPDADLRAILGRQEIEKRKDVCLRIAMKNLLENAFCAPNDIEPIMYYCDAHSPFLAYAVADPYRPAACYVR